MYECLNLTTGDINAVKQVRTSSFSSVQEGGLINNFLSGSYQFRKKTQVLSRKL